MIDECIKSFRNAILSLSILSVFLVLVVIDMSKKVDAIVKLEQTAISYLLINESPNGLIIPNREDDAKQITLRDAGYSYMDLGLALAHMNYSLPLWFGEQYCQDESQGEGLRDKKIIYEWLSWEVTVSPNECIYKSPVDVITPLLEEEKIIPQRLALVSPKKVRVPYYDVGRYKDYLDYSPFILDTSFFSCLTEVNTPDIDHSSYCNFEDAEKRHAQYTYWQQVGMRDRTALFKESISAILPGALDIMSEKKLAELESMSEEKGDGPYFASLQLQVKHKQTGHLYLLTIDNMAILKNRYNPKDKNIQVVDFPLIYTPWFDEKRTESDILLSLRLLYIKSTKQFKHEITKVELINWVQDQVLEITEGKIDAPFIGTPVPLSALLSIVLLIYAVLLAWTYHLSSVINGLTYEDVKVPWMLLLLKRQSEKKSFLRYIDSVLAFCLLLMRAMIIMLPSVVIFTLLFRGDVISNYFLPNPDLKNIVLIVVTPLFLLASAIIYIEMTTIKKLMNA